MEKLDPDFLPPLPSTLEDAHKEIRYLQRLLYNERLQWTRRLEKMALNHKSAVGEVKKLKEMLDNPAPKNPKGAWEI